jgi:NADH-quinone oxidoreductase subunit N
MRLFFLISALLVCILGMISLPKQRVPRVEFYNIVLVVSAAMMLLVQSHHFVMFFVALETITIGFYILVSYFRTSTASLEAGLKYLISGALSSSILLFGIVLLYGVSGNPYLPGHSSNGMDFTQMNAFLAANPHEFLASVGIVMVLAGVAFKIGAVPFQIWIPDVYEGAPTAVTAFLAVASKAAGFGILIILVTHVFSPYAWLVYPVLTVMAGATILFGNLAALTQHNVKRLIGLSGVSHAGFLLLGVVASATDPLGFNAVYFYLFAYMIASFAVFGVMAHVAGVDDSNQELDHYAGLSRDNPFLAAVLAVGLGSLAGIPPLAGFMGKFFIFIAAFRSGHTTLLGIAIIGVVISIYYYFGWIRAAFFDSRVGAAAVPKPAFAVTAPARLVLGVLALASIVLGFYQGPFGAWLASR